MDDCTLTFMHGSENGRPMMHLAMQAPPLCATQNLCHYLKTAELLFGGCFEWTERRTASPAKPKSSHSTALAQPPNNTPNETDRSPMGGTSRWAAHREQGKLGGMGRGEGSAPSTGRTYQV